MAQEGYLVISDITGYTAFLSQSELDHAEDSLRSLLNLLLGHTKPPLVVSGLEGDAVLSYAPQGSFLQGQTLVETLENAYVAFRRALEHMVLNTTCTCNACRNIPSLDLKFFVHYGTFIIEQLGSHTEIVGNDVNLVHRLMKNSITEKTGFKAYTAYTQSAVDALGISELCLRMTPHTESHEHLGEVMTHVQDMHPVWDHKRSETRIAVQPADALLTVEWDFPLGPALMWDYLTTPESRALLMGSESAKVTGRTDGRLGLGTTYVCAHGKSVYPETVVDWQPFEQYTFESTGFLPKTASLCTIWLTPTEDGTRVDFFMGKAHGPFINQFLENLGMRLMQRRYTVKGLQALQDRITQDIAEGNVVQSVPAEIPSDDIEEAIAESLAR